MFLGICACIPASVHTPYTSDCRRTEGKAVDVVGDCGLWCSMALVSSSSGAPLSVLPRVVILVKLAYKPDLRELCFDHPWNDLLVERNP